MDDGLVDKGEKLLGDGLSGGEEAGAPAGGGDDDGPDGRHG